MNKNFSSNLRTGFAIAILLLVASAVASYYTINRLIESSRWVDHTNQVLNVSESVISYVKDGETGQRGYLITGQQDFLEPYNGSYDKAMRAVAELKSLTTDNLVQQLNTDSLSMLIGKRYAVLQQGIEDKKANANLNIFVLRDGTAYMQRIRLMVQKIQHIEEGLLVQRTTTMKRFVTFAPIAIIVATALAIGITMFFFRRVISDAQEKQKLNEELRQKDAETTSRIDIIQHIAGRIASGDYSVRVNDEEKDELGSLSVSLNKMAVSLDHSVNALKEREWLQAGTAQLGEKVAGDKTVQDVAADGISFIASYTHSLTAALYISENNTDLYVAGSYALPAALTDRHLKTGEGLPGQCFSDKQLLIVENISEDLYTVSAAGNLKPQYLLLYPVFFEGHAIGVIELGSLTPFGKLSTDYLKNISELMGISINTAISRFKLKELLEETQAQSEELQSQHRELENMNAELEVQTEKLQTSEEELKVQQEELMETNQELEERSRLLEEKNHMIVVRNLEIQKKAEELEESTRYKSEFLANMSHELRTPLNSVLLLSRLLSENNTGNLNNEQVEYAQVIQSSGSGLLQLIDEILDLSKIESGKIDVEYERIQISEILENMRRMFEPMAKEKNVTLILKAEENVPPVIETDRQKLEQILKNLFSNALKFTPAGSIMLNISVAPNDRGQVVFAVSDTGIGVPADKQQMIFEAFQQADGSTKRKYGGTGLGLSISRQLARLLGGEIALQSSPGEGSNFVLTIPVSKVPNIKAQPQKIAPAPSVEKNNEEPVREQSPFIVKNIPQPLPDDRRDLQPGDKVILVVEDDLNFARALVDFARQKAYKVIHLVRGDEVMSTVLEYMPIGVLLDIQLPIKDGLTVMEELKKDLRTRHIPVHIMSSFEVKRESISRGAVDFISKPVAYEQMDAVLERIEQAVNTDLKKVLIVEDNSYHAKALAYFLSSNEISSEISGNINDSVSLLQNKEVNCVILDMGLPGHAGYEVLDVVKQHAELEAVPIIIFTGRSLSRTEEQRIRQYADAIVVKTAHSYQRILNEVALFLHIMEEKDETKKSNRRVGTMDAVLKGKTVLIADDDVRNIFALTKVLEKHKVNVVTAIDGSEAFAQLHKEQKIDLVLMDMMMPEMDGYETITKIRGVSKWKRLPIIAVTAKAMTGDREKCIKAGASDYISKPVDTDQLLSLMRVWLYETV